MKTTTTTTTTTTENKLANTIIEIVYISGFLALITFVAYCIITK